MVLDSFVVWTHRSLRPRAPLRLMLPAVIVVFCLSIAQSEEPGTRPRVKFDQAIAPLLTRHCIRCHRPENRKGDVSLVSAADLETAAVVEPGDPAASLLIEAVSPPEPGGKPTMPKEGTPLSADQVGLLRQWVAEGAVWPKGFVLKESAKAGADWWSLRPLAAVEPPSTQGIPAAWAAHPVDRFVFATLRAKGLEPSLPADRRTLIRRLTYDLTGMPPTPEEMAAFVADDRPGAYEAVVDRLLASPRYGEQWGRHWLDVVRFGESRGYERNEIIPNAWPFRDYIIRSFNNDVPFDRLVGEHLAGDVIGKDQPDREIGTTFLVCGPYDDVGNQDAAQAAVIRANTLDDIIRATSEAFLGITLGCARCHDHKFDPVTQRDYYSLYATFAGVRHGSRTIATAAGRAQHAARLDPLRKKEAETAATRQKIEDAVLARGEARKAVHEAKWTRPAVRFEGNEETFPAVDASAVRLVVTATDGDPHGNAGYQIDEFEVWTDGSQLTERRPGLARRPGRGAVAIGRGRRRGLRRLQRQRRQVSGRLDRPGTGALDPFAEDGAGEQGHLLQQPQRRLSSAVPGRVPDRGLDRRQELARGRQLGGSTAPQSGPSAKAAARDRDDSR